MEQLEPFLTELWVMSFRCLDDIKESVRVAALLTAKTLGNITIRFCDPLYYPVQRSQKVMDEMVPFLLKQGLLNMAEEVRKFSLGAILKLCKTSGILLKPHVTNIICTFLESLSSLEPQFYNYLTFHSESYSISQNDLDQSRLSAAKASPIMEAIQECVQYLDTEQLEDFSGKFCSIIRRGVGLPTRSGCARLVYILVQKIPSELKPYSDSIMKALAHGLGDRNATVRKAYAGALGYLVKLCSPGAIDAFANSLRNNYLESKDELERSVAPVTFLEITQHSSNVAIDLHPILLPLAYMGSRDSEFPKIAEIWKKVWEENTGGAMSAIKKWKTELLAECTSILKENPSWNMKKQVGKAITDISKALKEDVVDILPPILDLLVESLKGRTWDGKEAVLESLSVAVVEGVSYFNSNPSSKRAIEDIIIREAQKSNLSYKRPALEYLGNVFEAFKSDRYGEIKDYLISIATAAEDRMEIDNDSEKPLLLSVQANAFQALAKSFPFSVELQSNTNC
jgi:proteasome component ECM29